MTYARPVPIEIEELERLRLPLDIYILLETGDPSWHWPGGRLAAYRAGRRRRVREQFAGHAQVVEWFRRLRRTPEPKSQPKQTIKLKLPGLRDTSAMDEHELKNEGVWDPHSKD